MYPYSVLFGLDLYTIFLCVGIISALVTFRVFSDRQKMYWKLQNFAILVGVASIVCGYGSAVLFQGLYNFLADTSKGFVLNNSTGSTFYGGLIGGVACFLLFYFTVGAFIFKDKIHVKKFFDIANIAAASISVAHACGRLGCLMAGCCHGAETNAWYGVYFVYYKIKAVPIQLFEAIFLFALFALFCYRIAKKKSYNLPLYMALYGVWRFTVEFFRADDRGATIVSFLSPSQLIALLMVLGSIGLFFGERYVQSKLRLADSDNAKEDAREETIENIVEEEKDDED